MSKGLGAHGAPRLRQIQLPIPWHFDHAKKIGEAVCKIYDDFSSGIEPELATKKIAFTSAEESNDGSTTGHLEKSESIAISGQIRYNYHSKI